MVVSRQILVNDLINDPMFPSLVELYANEMIVDGMPIVKPDFAHYSVMEANGLLSIFGAYKNDSLIGFLSVAKSIARHYSQYICCAESFFVMEEYRSTGAGLVLLKHAERVAIESGAIGFFVSAQSGSKLDQVMSKVESYKEASVIYFKGFQNE